MTLTDLKSTISQTFGFPLVAMNLQAQVDLQTGDINPEWVSHWENTKRVRITLHTEVLAHIKADPKCNNLAFKQSVIQPEGFMKDKDGNITDVPFAPYTSLVVIKMGDKFVDSI